MTLALACIGLLGILVFGIGFADSMTRGRTGTNYVAKPDPTDPLYKMVRAHGNAIEYAPILALLIYVLAVNEPAAWVIWTAVAVTLCRYLHAIGMIVGPTLDAPYPLRFVGALGTYLGGSALAVAIFLV